MVWFGLLSVWWDVTPLCVQALESLDRQSAHVEQLQERLYAEASSKAQLERAIAEVQSVRRRVSFWLLCV